jgi:hypothetical protein
VNIILGIWVLISPFVLSLILPRMIWNNVVIGIVVGILAIIRANARNHPGWSWLNVILGIWLIISPFVFGLVTGAGMWNNIVLGIIIAALALGNASARMSRRWIDSVS